MKHEISQKTQNRLRITGVALALGTFMLALGVRGEMGRRYSQDERQRTEEGRNLSRELIGAFLSSGKKEVTIGDKTITSYKGNVTVKLEKYGESTIQVRKTPFIQPGETANSVHLSNLAIELGQPDDPYRTRANASRLELVDPIVITSGSETFVGGKLTGPEESNMKNTYGSITSCADSMSWVNTSGIQREGDTSGVSVYWSPNVAGPGGLGVESYKINHSDHLTNDRGQLVAQAYYGGISRG